MHMLVYVSEYIAEQPIDLVIENIVTVSKKQNSLHQITGVLFYHHNKFLQILEGEQLQIQQLMKNIKHDNRHTNVDVFIDQPVSNRSFPDWNMDSFDLAEDYDIDTALLKELKQQFSQTCQLDAWLFLVMIKQVLRTDKLLARRDNTAIE